MGLRDVMVHPLHLFLYKSHRFSRIVCLVGTCFEWSHYKTVAIVRQE